MHFAGLTKRESWSRLGQTSISDTLTSWQGLGVEVLITFVLVMTVFACCDENRRDLQGSRPLTVGVAATCLHLTTVSYVVPLR
jgi:aquaporin-4